MTHNEKLNGAREARACDVLVLYKFMGLFLSPLHERVRTFSGTPCIYNGIM